MAENVPAGLKPNRLLDHIDSPRDLKSLSLDELQQLASEVRADMIDSVSLTGGHLGAGLGVVELTIALHHVFDTPNDKLIWDVGHQAYPHKILTGRRSKMNTLRQGGGLSGFTRRSESVYDPFGAAHSSTSISAALGMAEARDLSGDDMNVIAVIGDGAISAGMAYEAMNNAGSTDKPMLIVLNDNDMSIAPPVGAMSAYLARLISSSHYRTLRDVGKQLTRKLPKFLFDKAKRSEEYARGFLTGGTLFEELGLYYVGPVDGHRLDHLLPVLNNIRSGMARGPVLLHVVTEKGKGYQPAEQAPDKYHGVKAFDVSSGKQAGSSSKAPSFTSVFADSLIDLAARDDRVVAITAAMPSGTGLDRFGKHFPDRAFDVGIAEQHAVTFAAGLSTQGYKPFVAIYSTFLQRAYDQIVHDVAIQSLPVRFAIDRAGLVGADGATHAGSFDIAYLGCLPGMVLMAAADEADLARMVVTAHGIDDRPSAFRFPRGDGLGVAMPDKPEPLPLGKGRIVVEGGSAAVLCYGARLNAVLAARDLLADEGCEITVVNALFAKPLDGALIDTLVQNHPVLVTVEEGSRGGFGAFVADYLAEKGWLDGSLKFRSMTLPDCFQDHDKPEKQYQAAGLDSSAIATLIRRLVS